jgi:hypothetical protein
MGLENILPESLFEIRYKHRLFIKMLFCLIENIHSELTWVNRKKVMMSMMGFILSF